MEEKNVQNSPEMTDQQLAQVSGGEDSSKSPLRTVICQKCGMAFSPNDPGDLVCPTCVDRRLTII